MGSRGLNTFVLFCAAGICAKALALMVQLEGWAYVDIIAATSDVVVCSKRVSGAEDELFALDTLGKKVLWRKNAYAVTRGETDGLGNLITVEIGDRLVSRKLKNGDVNWHKDLHAIAPGEPSQHPLPSDPNLARPSGLRYEYRDPLIRGEKAFVFRQARRGSPDRWSVLFEDWLVFDTADGRLLHHGSGACLGLAGDVPVVSKDDNTIVAINPSDYSQTEIYRDSTRDRLLAQPIDPWSRGTPAIQYSHRGRCIFNISTIPGNASTPAVYDSSNRKLTVIKPREKQNLPDNWILLSDYAIGYSATGRIAVYDADGKFLRESTLDTRTDADSAAIQFAGTSGTGAVIFRRAESLLVFDIPSLELTDHVERKPAQPWGRVFIRRSSDIIYSVEGNTSLQKMRPDRMPHKLTINLISLKSGQTLWSRIEEATIKKHHTDSPPH